MFTLIAVTDGERSQCSINVSNRTSRGVWAAVRLRQKSQRRTKFAIENFTRRSAHASHPVNTEIPAGVKSRDRFDSIGVRAESLKRPKEVCSIKRRPNSSGYIHPRSAFNPVENRQSSCLRGYFWKNHTTTGEKGQRSVGPMWSDAPNDFLLIRLLIIYRPLTQGANCPHEVLSKLHEPS